jgi:hypothetical protein
MKCNLLKNSEFKDKDFWILNQIEHRLRGFMWYK